MTGCNDEFNISFEFESKEYRIESEEVCKMVINLNEIMSKILDKIWGKIDLNMRTLINSKPKIESLFRKEKYLKFNELLRDDEKKFIIDLLD